MTAGKTRYRALSVGDLPDVLAAMPAARRELGGDRANWQVREVGDGNLNLVFIVTGESGGVVVKQALPYVRLVGESWPLPLERSHYEHLALTEQAAHAPRLVPQIYGHDRHLAMIAMEYLHPHIIMRKGLIRGIEYPKFAADIAEFMAQVLFKTSVLATGAAEHKSRIAAFAGNTELCRITEDLVFTDPYRVAPLNRWTAPHLDGMAKSFREDAPLKIAVAERKLQFMTSAEALIHGDLHTGSIMLTEGDTRVIDPEFAFVGPMGFDVGAVLGNLLLAYYSQAGHEARPRQRDPYRAWILRQVESVWTLFETKFLDLWRKSATGAAFAPDLFPSAVESEALESERRRFMEKLLADSAAFAGIKMIRRILGLAHIEDLESIKDENRRAACEKKALLLGRELILSARALAGVGDMLQAAREIEGGAPNHSHA